LEVVVTEDGLITLPSAHSAVATMDRLEAALRAKDVIIFARVDHAAGAAIAGLDLRPTQVLIFGNPKAGTPLMQIEQSIGIDLPLKILTWEDAEGKAWLSYNDPAWLAGRHNLGDVANVTIKLMTAMLETFAGIAARPD
jgi:uncharacterized protein (DUF302 family)